MSGITSKTTKAEIWASVEKALRAAARHEGWDEDEFVRWIKDQVRTRGEIREVKIPKTAQPTQAARSAPDD